MSASPAPATVSIPPRELRNRAPKQARRESAVEAPGADYSIDISLLLARVTIRGVAGVSSAAVAEYIAILQGDLASAARLARLNAPTLPAPPGDGFKSYYERNHLPNCLCTACDPNAEREWRDSWVPPPPPPDSIEAAVLDAVEDNEHDLGCACPDCTPDDDGATYCADEGHQVLTSGAAYYGTSSMGGW